MPNYVLNTLTIEAKTKERLEEILEEIRSEDEALSLERICPPPADFINMPYSVDEGGVERIAGLHNGTVKDYKDLFEFHLGEWGCKWDLEGVETIEVSETVIAFSFDSANSPPHFIIGKLNDKYEDVDFHLQYIESGNAFGGIINRKEETQYSKLETPEEYKKFAIEEFGFDNDDFGPDEEDI